MFGKNLNRFRRSIPTNLYLRNYVPSALEEKIKENGEHSNKKEFNKEYYLQNRDKLKESNRNYYLENKDKMKEFNRKYYLENKEKKTETNRIYYNENKEKIKKFGRDYYLRNKDKIKGSKNEEFLQNKENKTKEYNEDYYIKNKDKMKKLSRKYYLANKDKMKNLTREFYVENKDKMKEYAREYYLQNKEKIKLLNVKKNIERNNGIYIPSYSWKSDDSVREYFERIAPLLHINDLSDWYRISREQILDLKGRGIFYKFNTLGEALKVAYPEYDWDMSKFSFKGKKSTQRWLYVKLKKLLPNAVIEEEYNHPELLWQEEKKKYMQLDIWVSEYNLALEYQGEHHYYDLPGAYGPSSTTQIFNERDEKKKQLCASKGINLVCIPYWWDGHEDSLSSTLHTVLPNIFEKTGSPPIPVNLPTDYVKKNVKINE